MKSIIKKSAIALIAALPLFTACQDEPELGSLLHPEEQTSSDSKVFINEIAAPTNTAQATVVKTPVDLVIPEDTYEFYVRLSAPVASDVVVTVAEDAAAAAAAAPAYSNNDNKYNGLPEGCLTLENASVTIAAGQCISAEPIKFKVADSEAIRIFSGKAIAAVKIVGIKSASNVALAKDHNTYYTLLNKKETNFKGFSETLLQKTKLTSADLTYTFEGEDCTAKLMDTYTSTWADMYNGPEPIICKFNSPQPLAGVAYQYGYNPYYGPYTIDVLTSDDGENWVSQTDGILETGYTDAVVCINFYSAITCKYVKFIPHTCVYGFYYGDEYNTPCVGELYMFK